jgi:hypothetical protein
MSFLKAKKLGFLAAGVTALALFAAQGCSSGDDSQASPGSSGKTGSAGKSGSGNEAGDAANNGGSGNTGNTGNTAGNTEGGAAGEAGAAGAAGAAGTPPVDPGCLGANDCYSCAPKTNNQFLNACVEGGCPAHFDNGTLTKLDLVGTL